MQLPDIDSLKIESLSDLIDVACGYHCIFKPEVGWRVTGVYQCLGFQPRVVYDPTKALYIPGLKSKLRKGHFINPKTMFMAVLAVKDSLLSQRASSQIMLPDGA